MEKKMDVIINKEKIDFDLDGNENCGSIVNDLRSWLFQKKHIMLKTIVNSEEYNPVIHDALIISEIKKIEIDTEHIEILTLNSLSELKNYADRVEDNIGKINAEPSKFSDQKILDLFLQMKDGYSWCVKAVDNISKVLQVGVDNVKINQLCNDFTMSLNELAPVIDPVVIKRLMTSGRVASINNSLLMLIAELFTELKAKKTLLSFDELIERSAELREILSKLKDELITVSEKLQIGESVEAMNLLKEKFSTLESITNFFQQAQHSVSIDYKSILVNDKSVQEYLDNYLKLLKELLDSFETKDYVMLADLIEYELTEYITVFIETMNQISSIVRKLKNTTSEAGSVNN